jgi:hypothetical protein
MKDFSDIVNRNIVIFLLFAFIIYLNFVSSQLQRDKNWQGVKCNPLQMVVGSIINSEGSNNAFKRCMQYSYSENLNNQIDQYSRANEKKMKNTSNKLDQITNRNNPVNRKLAQTDAKIDRLYDSTRGSLASIQDLRAGVYSMAYNLKGLLNDLNTSPSNVVKIGAESFVSGGTLNKSLNVPLSSQCDCEEVNNNKNNNNSRSTVSGLGGLDKPGNIDKKLQKKLKLNLGGLFKKSKKRRGAISIFNRKKRKSRGKKRRMRNKRRR